MSKKIVYLLLALSLGLNVGVIATTLAHKAGRPQGPPHGREGGPPPGHAVQTDPQRMIDDHVDGITNHLGLDEGQQLAVREVLERHADELTALQREAAEKGDRLAEAFAAPDYDPDEFLRLVAETSVARSRLDSLSAVMLTREAAVLTPEQRIKFAEVAPTVHSQPQHPPREGGPPHRRR